MSARFIVLRNCPPDFVDLEGRWYSADFNYLRLPTLPPGERFITFQPTGRFETRDDGVKAEVYEPQEAR